jgi:hypothetical protein
MPGHFNVLVGRELGQSLTATTKNPFAAPIDSPIVTPLIAPIPIVRTEE